MLFQVDPATDEEKENECEQNGENPQTDFERFFQMNGFILRRMTDLKIRRMVYLGGLFRYSE